MYAFQKKKKPSAWNRYSTGLPIAKLRRRNRKKLRVGVGEMTFYTVSSLVLYLMNCDRGKNEKKKERRKERKIRTCLTSIIMMPDVKRRDTRWWRERKRKTRDFPFHLRFSSLWVVLNWAELLYARVVIRLGRPCCREEEEGEEEEEVSLQLSCQRASPSHLIKVFWFQYRPLFMTVFF